MDPATNCLLVYMTAPDRATARDIAAMLVERRLASGVNVLDGARSLYWWAGAVQDEPEALLFAQTTYDRYPAFQEAVLAMHPYEVPCVVALPMAWGNPDYLRWVEEETSPARPSDS